MLFCIAYGVFIFESIQTGLTTAAAFDQYVYSDGDVARVDTFPYVWFSVPIMAAITAAVVQIFFAWRIKILDRTSSYILPVTVVMVRDHSCVCRDIFITKTYEACIDAIGSRDCRWSQGIVFHLVGVARLFHQKSYRCIKPVSQPILGLPTRHLL